MKTQPHKHSIAHTFGFTFIELLVAIAVFSVLLGIGIPSFNDALHSHQAKGVVQKLYSSYQYARTEAVTRGKKITLCGSDDGVSCSVIWQKSLLIFEDANNDKRVNETEWRHNIDINLAHGYIHTKAGLTSPYLHLNSDGTVNRNGSIIVCQPGQPEHTQQIIYWRTGRPYFSKITTRGNQLINSRGDPVPCA